MATERIELPEVTLSVRDEGPADGAPVLLLHGFPDRGSLWDPQVGALTAAGLRAIVPDQRGFGDSDRPEGVEHYRLTRIVDDAIALLDAKGVQRAHVVGHDWGAGVAWVLAMLHPERVERLVAISVGCPGAVPVSLAQRMRSWYMLFFQPHGVAEAVLPRADWALLREWLGGKADVERIVADLSRPGALTAGLNWYRANLDPRRELQPPRPLPRVTVPALGIWSDGDPYLLEPQMEGSGAWCDASWRYRRIEDAGHWIQRDAPEALNGLLLEFLT